MRIAVCIKQVPLLDSVRFNPKSKRVVREDVASTTNPLDLLALGHALALRDAASAGAEVTVITMGPPNARGTLEDAIRRGADRGILLTDRRFAGADTLATVRALKRALEDQGFDLVLLGRSTLDGATAQVAPQLAEVLGVPQVTQATGLAPAGEQLLVERESDDGSERLRLSLPAVVSVQRGPAPPAPDPARTGEIREISAEDLGGEPRDFGTRGSPTFVKDLRVLPEPKATVVVHDLDAAVHQLKHLLGEASTTVPGSAAAGTGDRTQRTVWALAERLPDGDLHPISFEAIACGHAVADDLKARVVSVLLCADPGDAPSQLAAHGADAVLVLEDPALAEYSTEAYTTALCAAIEELGPHAVIGPWTADGRDYVPRAAARLALGLTGDFVALEVADPEDEEPDLLWIKPAWAGTVEAPIIAHTTPSVGTLRPGAVAALAPDASRAAPVQVLRPQLDGDTATPACEQRLSMISGAELVDCAPVLVSIGAGMGAELIEQARELVRRCGGALAASAEAVAEGLLPPQCEVGVLRRSVSPRLFLALGHHGAADLDAARRAGTIATVGYDGVLPGHTRVDLAIGLAPADVLDRLLAETPVHA
jgi:electron transfer flavoprotein alpha subunit